MINKIILLVLVSSSGKLMAGGAAGGSSGGSALKLQIDSLSATRLNVVREALVMPQDFRTIVNKSILNEPVVIDDQELLGVKIGDDSVELAPAFAPLESSLIVRPAAE